MNLAEAIKYASKRWFDPDESDSIEILYNEKAIKAHLSYGGPRGGYVIGKSASIIISRDDVLEPQYRDKIEINGESWRASRDDRVEPLIQGDAHTWTILIVRDGRPKGR